MSGYRTIYLCRCLFRIAKYFYMKPETRLILIDLITSTTMNGKGEKNNNDKTTNTEFRDDFSSLKRKIVKFINKV